MANTYANQAFGLKLSYGAANTAGAVYWMNFTVTNTTFANPYIYEATTGLVYNVTAAYTIDSTQSPVGLKLGVTSNSAEDADILAGNGPQDSIGKADHDIYTSTPLFVVAPITYTGSDEFVFKLPGDQLKTHIAFGKIGGTVTTAGGTYYSFNGPIIAPVAKLDSQVTSDDKTSHDLIVVGDSCVNSIAADATGATYGVCPDPGTPKNAAIIKILDDKYASGHQVVLVAGWEAADTKLAAHILQNYDQATVSGKLVGKSSITVSGTDVTTATIV